MSLALPYDSDGGRDFCGAITGLMTGESYAQSARIAERMGPFGGYPRNREPMLDVIRMHRDSLRPIKEENVQPSLLRAAQESWDDGARSRRKIRLQEFAGFRARSHRHDRLHDGLRHHRHRARSRAREAEEAGGRRRDQDRQQHRAAGADEARLSAGGRCQDRRLHRRRGQNRRRARTEARAPSRVRLLARADGRRTLDCLARPPAHDGSGSAVPFRRDQQDDQHARGIHGRRHHRSLYRILETRAQGRGHLSRQFQALAAALGRRARRKTRKLPRLPQPVLPVCAGLAAAPAAADCPQQQELFDARARRESCQRSATPSRTNSRSAATKAISPSACTTTASPAKSSSRWRRKAPRFPASWTPSRCPSRSRCSTACRSARWWTNSCNSRFEPSGYTGNPKIRYAKSVVDYIGRWLGGKFISPDYLDSDGAALEEAPAAAVGSAAPLTAAPVRVLGSRNDHTGARRHRRRTVLLRVRHAHDAQRQLLQVLELRFHLRLQLDRAHHPKNKRAPVPREPFVFQPEATGQIKRGPTRTPLFLLYPQVPVSARRNRPTPGIRDSRRPNLHAPCHVCPFLLDPLSR